MLEGVENQAREGRKGLWADPQPVPPWDWQEERAFVGRTPGCKICIPWRGSIIFIKLPVSSTWLSSKSL